MAFPDNYVEIKDRITDLRERFFEKETPTEKRKEIIAEMEQYHEYLAGSLFGTIAHYYKFESDGKPYTLEYERTYCLNALKATYWLNLYSGQDDDKQLLRQTKNSYNSPVYIKFCKLVDDIKNGTFDVENSDMSV